MNWVSLTLLAPFFWVLSNFVDKYVLGKYSQGIYDFLFFSSLTSWLVVLVMVILRGWPELSLFSLVPVLTGFILIYSYGFYAKALQQGETSSVVILFKLIPVCILILGFIFLGQRLAGHELWGFSIVLAGAVLVSFEGSKKIVFKGFKVLMVAIVLWSVMTLLIDYGLTKMTFWDYFLLDSLGSALAGMSLLAIPSMRKEIVQGLRVATARKYLIFNGNNLLDVAGQLAVKQALVLAPSAALVSVVMQVQSLYAILLGFLLTLWVPHLIKENISRTHLMKKLVGVAIMFGGVYLILM